MCFSILFLLCVFVHAQVDSNGMVSVQPDFNDGKAPYKIETLGRGTYVHMYINVNS